jgi:hypothetical protein
MKICLPIPGRIIEEGVLHALVVMPSQLSQISKELAINGHTESHANPNVATQ